MKNRETKAIGETPKEFKELFAAVRARTLENKKIEERDLRASIGQYKSNLDTTTKKHEEVVKRIESLEKNKSKAKEEAYEEAKRTFEQFSKNIFVESVSANEKYIEVVTKLLFADIREKAGTKKKRRACIGAFKIFIPTRLQGANRDYLYVENLLFNHRQNWAVTAHRVCWGEWKIDIDTALRRENYYEAFEVVLALLRSADDDAAAYEPSHEWRNRRGMSMICSSSEEPNIGDHVIFTRNWDGLNTLGLVATCIYISPGYRTYRIKDASTIGKMGEFDWNAPSDCVQIISKGMYDSQSVYKISEQKFPASKILEKIDDLPDGSSREEAQSIGNKLSIKLDLKELMKV